ncbi:hypothetical protein [Mammaliicoccus sciuri]|uniref:hypothetical protein n=1 Tax=Mammaliicoccus sciuri TaxID=1296 RepID=UPI002DB566A7|nr:hypothetical protein [Mammaliicoccus sciuri]MEB6233801.1 hypothetical protein [Mammaliicoccus sciuri]
MNEPTEFKYPLDENGEPYFAGSHVKAIEGMQDIEDRLQDTENSMKDVRNLQNALQGLIKVTTTSYENDVEPGVKTNTSYTGNEGLKCEIKEVKIGIEGITPIIKYKTISYNLKEFKLGKKVAKLPSDFLEKAHTFPASGNGNLGAYRVEVKQDGTMTVWGGLNDNTLPASSYWIYGQYTWIEQEGE